MNRRNKTKATIMTTSHLLQKWIVPVILCSALLLTSASCGDTFEDGTTSKLMKPEILSIILEPPEAAPGDTVTATFLMGDQLGPLAPPLQFWMLSPPGNSGFAGTTVSEGSLDSEDGETALDDSADMDNIGFGPSFTFTVPDAQAYTFDDNGLAPQVLTLLLGIDADALPDLSNPENALADIEALISDGTLKMALRTLIVSQRDEMNRNPRVNRVSVRSGTDENDVVFVASYHDDIAAGRAAAAAQPFVYDISRAEPLVFVLDAEDEGDMETAVRYQWISTEGDFGGRREREQTWEPPFYQFPAEGQSNQSGQENVDPRVDPNLVPVWCILRDNGVENQLGQSWIEFYVRIVLPTSGD